MNTNAMMIDRQGASRPVYLDGQGLMNLADTGEYLAELDDGRVVDLQHYFYSNYDPNLSGFFKKLLKKVKKIIRKPLKLLPAVIGIGAVTGKISITGLGKKLLKKTGVAKLVKAGKLTEVVKTVRVALQETGVIPTGEQVQEVVDEMFQVYPPAPVPPAALPAPSILDQLKPYWPYIAGGAAFLLLYPMLITRR